MLREEQADSILTSYKIGDTESHVSFHFYATFFCWRNALGEKTHGMCLPFVHMETRSSARFQRLQGRTILTPTHHLSSSLCRATGYLYMLMAKAQTVG